MSWLLLILSLPTSNATARMRAWRALKACGAAVARDGVYLLPDGEAQQAALAAVAQDVRTEGGQAHVLHAQPTADDDFAPLFDRRAEFGELLAAIAPWRTASLPIDAPRQVAKWRKAFDALVAVDFFPGEAQRQAAEALQDVTERVSAQASPGEPQPVAQAIARLDAAAFRGRRWATRRRPWVDRLASAWLIRRFIDVDAQFLWLAEPADCPADALGYDFDGARFTHVGARVTFETLLTSFGLDTQPALARLGLLVHSLDVGGVQVPEAAGIERVLAGMRDAILDDDQLLAVANGVFEGLYLSFDKDRDAT
jgi:hypothetical protein